jgi:glycosyltransferase involved in cell wall biosynthesis
MPTWNRYFIAETAVRCFSAQTYTERVLCVIDDSDQPAGVEKYANRGDDVRVIRCDWRVPTAMKWNLAIAANPDCEVVTFWDDDDWYHSRRIEQQLTGIAAGHQAVYAPNPVRFYDVDNQQMYTYIGARPINLTYMFTREFWRMRRGFHEQQFSVDVPGFFGVVGRGQRGGQHMFVVRRNYDRAFGDRPCFICRSEDSHHLVDGIERFSGRICRVCGFRVATGNVCGDDFKSAMFVRDPAGDEWSP